MTLDGFMAVLFIAVAIYALISPVQKMKARLADHRQRGYEMLDTLRGPIVLSI